MRETQDDAVDDLVHHQVARIGHFDQLVQKLDLATISVLKHKLDVQILALEPVEILAIVLQVQANELEAGGEDINVALDALLKLVLAFIEKGDDNFEQSHFPVHVLS